MGSDFSFHRLVTTTFFGSSNKTKKIINIGIYNFI